MIKSEDEFNEIISYAYDAPIIGVDTEGTGLNVLDNRDYCMGIGIAYRLPIIGSIQTSYFPFRHNLKFDPDDYSNLDTSTFLPRLKALLESKPITCHNLKYDEPALATLGIKVGPKAFCSLAMTHMLNENLPSFELDWLAKYILKDEKYNTEEFDKFIKIWGWPNLPIQLADPYCQQDASLHLRLFEYVFPKLKSEELVNLWPEELEFIRCLIKVETNGVRLNVELAKKLSAYSEQRMLDIIELLGFNPGTYSDLAPYLFDELKLPILDRGKPTKDYPEGRPSMTRKIMDEYDEMLESFQNPTAKLVVEFRQLQKARSTWYEGFQNKLCPDGRLRSNFKIHGTRTRRLSNSFPNLQQLPRRSNNNTNKETRQLLIPDDGFELWEYDYAQLELRIGTVYAGEKALVQVYNEDRDFFTELTLTAFPGMDPESTNPKTGHTFRYDIKQYFYARQYGAGITKQAIVLHVSEDEVRTISERIDNAYPGFKRTSKIATIKAKETGFVRYWTGHKRHFNFWDDKHHKAFNALIQGGAAQIVKRAMLRVDKFTTDDCRLLLQVHDSLVTEERIGTHEHYSKLIINAMEDFPQFGVKFAVDCHRWGDK